MTVKNYMIYKVVVIITIIAVIIGIWVTKNKEEDNSVSDNTSTTVSEVDKKLPDYDFEPADFNLYELKSYGVPIMLDFNASWCPSCQVMKPDLVELYHEYKDKMFILSLDVDKLENGTYGLPLQAVPTQYFFDSKGNPYVPTNPKEQNMIMLTKNETVEHLYTLHQGLMTKDEMLRVLEEMGVELNDK